VYKQWFGDFSDTDFAKNGNDAETEENGPKIELGNLENSESEAEEGEVKIDLELYGRNLSHRKLREFEKLQKEAKGKGGGYSNQQKMDFSKAVVKK
jgi:hypothetical protein